MTLIYLGIIIVLLQSYIRLQIRHHNLIKEHKYAMLSILQDVYEIKYKCIKDQKPK